MEALKIDSSEDILEKALQALRQRLGHEFPLERTAEYAKRLEIASELVGRKRFAEFLVDLANWTLPAEELEEVLKTLIVDESHFWRHPDQLDHIADSIVPELILRHAHEGPVLVWSAGCARGEEAHSISIKLEENGEDKNRVVKIIGTDLIKSSVAAAGRGRYNRWHLREVPSHIISRHFKEEGGEHQLSERVMSRASFRYHNLADDLRPHPFELEGTAHLVVCRNVLIYMDDNQCHRMLDNFSRVLVPGGYLVLGPSDPGPGPESGLAPSGGIAGVYKKIGRAFESPSIPGLEKSDEDPGQTPAAGDSTVRPFRRPGLDNALGDAERLYFRGHWLEAVSMLEQFEGEFEAEVMLARFYMDYSDREGVLRRTSRLVRLFPVKEESHYLNSQAFFKSGDLELAEASVRKSLYLNPEFVAGHILLALVLQSKGDDRESLRAWKNAEEILSRMNANEKVPFSDDKTAGELIEMIRPLENKK